MGQGISRIFKNRRHEDYTSMKQYFSDRTIQEVLIEGTFLTVGAAAEIDLAIGDTINYIAAEGQVYVRCEADDANQHSKYVYIQYQDDTGQIMPILTANLDGANSVTEVIVTGASDFYRLRQMICEIEAATGGTKGVILTDVDMGGADDVFGFIDDNNSSFALQRFFTQPAATCDSYLAHLHLHAPNAADNIVDTFFLDMTCTPRVLSISEGFAEPQAIVDRTFNYPFSGEIDHSPCLLLEGGTEVIFKIGDNHDAGIVHFEFVLLEVYPTNSTPSS